MFEDGEVLGLSRDGYVIQWNADARQPYNSGERLEDFGIHNLFPHEAPRVGVSREQLKKAEKTFFLDSKAESQ